MLILLPTPLGNLEDITFRALKALQNAKVILCEDTRVAKQLVHLLAKKYLIQFGNKEYYSLHEHNQKRFFSSITPDFFQKEVVYMSDAGMPAISDPGATLIQYVQEHHIPYTVLPGPNAAITAFAASGFEGDFTFYGFLPSKGEVRSKKLQEILQSSHHAIIYEAPHRLMKLLEELDEFEPERLLFLAKELTKKFEQYYKGTVRELIEEFCYTTIKGEWVIIVHKSNMTDNKLILNQEDILSLSLPKKEKAKLLAKISKKSVKEWYDLLTKS